jgi:serine/threonine-protein kinase
MVPQIGDIIADKYRIERRLGGGGMGTVFAATHLITGRRFALKWMNTRAVHDSAARERFIREFQAAGSIDHANVVAVLDAGSQDGALYIVMEYLEGESLAKKIARGPMAPDECVPIVVEAMRGVAAAHRLDIVHRDLKPDNIFVCSERTGLSVKVLDFGVMKPVNARAESLPTITARGMAVGTPPYMAPEQVLALQSIDHRVDIYAFGVILYEALSGRLPFADATGLVLLERIVRGGAPALSQFVSGVPIGLEATVMRALSRDPRRRFQQLADFAACLRPWAAGAGAFGEMAPAPRRVIEAVVLGSQAADLQPTAAEERTPRESDPESRPELPIEAALRRALARESRLPQRHAWNTPDADAGAEVSSEDRPEDAEAAGGRDSSRANGAERTVADLAWEDAFTRGVRGEPEPLPVPLPVPNPLKDDDARRSRVPTLPLRLQDIDAMRARFEAERAVRGREEEPADEAATTTQLAAPRRSRVSKYDLSPWPVESTADVWSVPTVMAVPAPRMPPMRNRTGWALVGAAALIVAGLAGLQWWDEEHVEEAEQSTSAATDIFSDPDPAGPFDDLDPASAAQLKAAEPRANEIAPAPAVAPEVEASQLEMPQNEAPYEAPAMDSVVAAAPASESVAAQRPPMDSAVPQAPASDSVVAQAPPMDSVVAPAPASEPVAAQRPPMDSAVARAPALDSVVTAAPASELVNTPTLASEPVNAQAPQSEALSVDWPRAVENSSALESATNESAELASTSTPSTPSTDATTDAARTSPAAAKAVVANAMPASSAQAKPASPAANPPADATAQPKNLLTATRETNTPAPTSASSATPTSASGPSRAAMSGGARGTTGTLSTAPTSASNPVSPPIEIVPASEPVAAHAPTPQRDVVLLAATPALEAHAPPSPPATSDTTRAKEAVTPAAARTQKPTPAPAPRATANTRAQKPNTPAAPPAPNKPTVLRAPGARITVTQLDVTPPAAPAPKKAAPIDLPSAPAAASGNAKPAPAPAPRKTSGVSMTDF